MSAQDATAYVHINGGLLPVGSRNATAYAEVNVGLPQPVRTVVPSGQWGWCPTVADEFTRVASGAVDYVEENVV